jgi:hypothetical protein
MHQAADALHPPYPPISPWLALHLLLVLLLLLWPLWLFSLQGLGATILRNTPANAVYLGTFEVLKGAAAQQLGCKVRGWGKERQQQGQTAVRQLQYSSWLS